MNCFSCERNLSAYIDDEAPNDVRLEIEAHLENCQTCRAEYESHLTTWEAVHAVPAGVTPDGLFEGIQTQLGSEAASTSLDDVALMIRGLAGEIQDLRRTVEELRQDVEELDWTEERPAAETRTEREGIRVTSANPFASVKRPETSLRPSSRAIRRSS